MNTFLYEMQQNDIALQQFLNLYGSYIYMVLFLIIYLKTAFVLLTFLPGDATAFIGGALVALGELNIFLLVPLLFVATVLGDTQNHCLGRLGKRLAGKWLTKRPPSKFEAAKIYFQKHGNKAIIFARFVPLMRTTIPFVTGYMRFPFQAFAMLNGIGGAVWVVLWIGAGMLLGQIPIIQNNMSVSLPAISLLPIVIPLMIYAIRSIRKAKKLNSV